MTAISPYFTVVFDDYFDILSAIISFIFCDKFLFLNCANESQSIAVPFLCNEQELNISL